jgi:hypothetical protein
MVIRKPQKYVLLAILKCFLAKSLNLAREKKKGLSEGNISGILFGKKFSN